MHVLVVEDDLDTQANLRDLLELDGYSVHVAGSAADVRKRDDWAEFPVVILDRRLPDGFADDLLPQLKERAPETSVIVVTGHSDLGGAIAALRHGAEDYILKPINPDALRATLARIAARRQLALEKARSEAAFCNLVEAAPSMILILYPDGTIAYFSPFAEQLTGYTAEEVLGKDYFPIFVPDEAIQKGILENIARIVAGIPTRGYENPIWCRDGTQRWMVWNAQRLDDYDGEPAVLAVGQDISSLKDAQDRALQAERLAAIGQMVAGLAHESRNALQRIQACLELLALEVDGRQEAAALITRAQQAQDELHRLYDEVRHYAAPLALKRRRVVLDRIVEDAWRDLTEVREGKEARLVCSTNGLDLACDADRSRVEQVFRNILENSLAAGAATIEVHCSACTLEGQPGVQASFCDDGPGLTPEARQRIFEPFFTTQVRGTGLGMAISRRIVEAHGGRIAVGNSTAGAEILVYLPRETQ